MPYRLVGPSQNELALCRERERVNSYPDHRALYRLPWSLPDNPIAWLESTSCCNMYCEGCYRANERDSHKSLDSIRAELEVFAKFRKFDGVSIAGGDPLTHPEIVGIVELATRMGYKPIVNTNGQALSDDLLRDLHAAGARGFTFHIDSKQARPGWRGKNEAELNTLRQDFADRLAEYGDISCAFNSTVYEETLPYAPEMIEWAAQNIDRVHVMVFIAFRQASGGLGDRVDFYVGDRKIPMEALVYSRPAGSQRLDISSRDVVAEIRKRFPDFAPCAYLNGSEKADSLKWLLTTRIGTKDRILGHAGPHFMELAQNVHHLRHGRFQAYAPPSTLRRGRTLALVGSLFDQGMRGVLRRYLRGVLARPWTVANGVYMQSVMIIQPIDILENGAMNMCDACPDITVHGDQLVWSCRLEECLKFGGFARAVPRRVPESRPERETMKSVARGL
jgi:MoaA/NifB/PqqE/SkfB family radical SAM enzyme